MVPNMSFGARKLKSSDNGFQKSNRFYRDGIGLCGKYTMNNSDDGQYFK